MFCNVIALLFRYNCLYRMLASRFPEAHRSFGAPLSGSGPGANGKTALVLLPLLSEFHHASFAILYLDAATKTAVSYRKW